MGRLRQIATFCNQVRVMVEAQSLELCGVVVLDLQSPHARRGIREDGMVTGVRGVIIPDQGNPVSFIPVPDPDELGSVVADI